MGKSSVLATLLEIDDNELLRVSATPGETTNCQTHRVVFSDRECVRFIDTPGFSQPVEAMREIQRIHGEGTPGLEAIREFMATAGPEFGDEKRLLEPLVEGAGVLYVVDPAKPLRDDFLAEMEILRWTGRPRLAVMNRRQGISGPDEEEWKSRLGGAFNLTRTFDAHHALYDERLRLLRSLLEIEEHHRAALEETIRLVEQEWGTRREEAAECVLAFLEAALGLRVSVTLDEKDLALETRRKRQEETLTKKYYDKLAKLERKCAGDLLKVYRHHLLKADADPASYQEIDLESSETWSKWGLNREQLTLVGVATGAAAGVALDAATAFFSHGVGTALGAITGGAAAWFKGGSLPDLKVDFRGGKGGIKLDSGEGRALTIGPPRNPNFPWVLLDGILTRYQQMLGRAHGRRDEERLETAGGGFTRGFSTERRKKLGKWFASCLKGKPERSLEPEVFAELLEALEEAGEDA